MIIKILCAKWQVLSVNKVLFIDEYIDSHGSNFHRTLVIYMTTSEMGNIFWKTKRQSYLNFFNG